MKTLSRYFILTLSVLAFCACSKELEDIDVWNATLRNETQLNARMAALEAICAKQNTNIESMQTIIEIYESGQGVTGIIPVIENGDTIGWKMSYGDGQTITIYEQSGSVTAPVIGVKQDTDGVYYWTLDGEWLLNDFGQKMRVTGNDGETGAAGVTPKLKVQDGDWYVSYDDGATWTYVGQATGDKGDKGDTGAPGDKGDKGDKGDTGDSMFQSVTYDTNYVYLTLSDGTVITLPRNGGSQGSVPIVNGAVQAAFSVAEGKQVYFSMGNLQYQASTDTWRFAEHQYDIIGTDNANISATNSEWIDLFGWGTSGYHDDADAYNKNYYPYSTSTSTVNTSCNYYGYGPSTSMTDPNLTGTSANYDWGVYNAISNGGNQVGKWRTLTKDEWVYLFQTRENATSLYFRATVNGQIGMVILPDNWLEATWSSFISVAYTLAVSDFTTNIYTATQWKDFDSWGAIFLPVAGSRYGTSMSLVGTYGRYWSSTYYSTSYAYSLGFNASYLYPSDYFSRSYGSSVRLVQDVE